MSNPWFRLYHEFATDPKIQMLSEADQRRFVMLLCLRCSNGDVTLQDDAIAFQMRISNEEWLQTKCNLQQIALIDDECKPVAWNKRQYVSDSSTARVRKHRERAKQRCNVTETPPESETDTETDNKTLVQFETFWSAYPNKKNKAKAQKKFLSLSETNRKIALADVQARAKSDPQWLKDGGQFVPLPTTYLNGERWNDEWKPAQSSDPVRKAMADLEFY